METAVVSNGHEGPERREAGGAFFVGGIPEEGSPPPSSTPDIFEPHSQPPSLPSGCIPKVESLSRGSPRPRLFFAPKFRRHFRPNKKRGHGRLPVAAFTHAIPFALLRFLQCTFHRC